MWRGVDLNSQTLFSSARRQLIVQLIVLALLSTQIKKRTPTFLLSDILTNS